MCPGRGRSGLAAPARYTADRPHAAQWRVTRPASYCPGLDARLGVRSISVDPQLGHTSASRSRSAAIKFSASEARYSLMPRRPTAYPSRGPAAGAVASWPRSSNLGRGKERGKPRANISRTLAALLLLGLCLFPAVASAQHTVMVDLGFGRDGSPRMTPDHVTVRPGDILRFRVMGGAPHAIGLTGGGLAPRVATAWNRAFVGRVSDLRGPMLLRTGDQYSIVVPEVPAGTYEIFCTTHRAYRASHLDLTVSTGR